jgi:hypothetical protein
MRIALLLRGHHFLRRDRFGFPLDGRRHLGSLQTQILEPLRRGHETELFLATYPSPILDEITAALAPRAVALPDPGTSSQASTFLDGLGLIQKQTVPCDRILCLRFDLEYLKPIDRWDIWASAKGIFFPWREYEKPWQVERRVGDALHVVDRGALDPFQRGLETVRRQKTGHLHLLYGALLPLTADLHFIESGFYDSNTLYSNRECRNPLYRIANRPRLPISQPYRFVGAPHPLSWTEKLHWKAATLLLRPTAFLSRLFFRPRLSPPPAPSAG